MLVGEITMTGDISFQLEESYRKVGFTARDDVMVTVQNLTVKEAEWLKGQIMILIQERTHR